MRSFHEAAEDYSRSGGTVEIAKKASKLKMKVGVHPGFGSLWFDIEVQGRIPIEEVEVRVQVVGGLRIGSYIYIYRKRSGVFTKTQIFEVKGSRPEDEQRRASICRGIVCVTR